jgi:hypothetical protein
MEFCSKPRTADEVRKAFDSIILEEKLAKSKFHDTGHKCHFLDRPKKLKIGTYVITIPWIPPHFHLTIQGHSSIAVTIFLLCFLGKDNASPLCPREPIYFQNAAVYLIQNM